MDQTPPSSPPGPTPRAAPAPSRTIVGVVGALAVAAALVTAFVLVRNDPDATTSGASPFDAAARAIVGDGPNDTALPAEAAAWPEFGTPTALPSSWKRFTPPGTAISIGFPGVPSPSGSTGGPTTRTGSYTLALATQTFDVAWDVTAPPAGSAATLEAQLQAAAARLVVSGAARPESVLTPVRYRGLPALRVRLSEPASRTLALVVRKGDVFVAASVSGPEIDLQAAGLFLSSLEVGRTG